MSTQVEYSKYISRYKNILEDIIRDNLIDVLNTAYAGFFGAISYSDTTPQDFYDRVILVLKARVISWLYMIDDKVVIEKLPPGVEGRISMKELSQIIIGTYIENEDCVVVSWSNFKAFLEKKIDRLRGLLSI